VLDRLGVSSGAYVVATMHRQSNVEDPQRLAALLRGFAALAERVPVLLPLHPHTRASATAAGLMDLLHGVRLLPPLTPVEFLALEAEAGLIVSDSGGVQEEACFLRRPLLVLRDTTERPELLDGWCELLGDRDPAGALASAWDRAPTWRESLTSRAVPYPQDDAGVRIVRELDARLTGSAPAVPTTAGVPLARPRPDRDE
jgi:UDP-N-acetylglucosamine 2-epimerase (non-hydrolysing)